MSFFGIDNLTLDNGLALGLITIGYRFFSFVLICATEFAQVDGVADLETIAKNLYAILEVFQGILWMVFFLYFVLYFIRTVILRAANVKNDSRT